MILFSFSQHSSGQMNPDKKALAYRIIRKLLDNQHDAYLVGGCVRDSTLGLIPPDYDIATSAPPETVQTLFKRTIPVGAHFGVILVVEEGIEFEVATFRADDRYIDGRRPTSVRYVSAEEDVKRRDFTINGLLFDIQTGTTIDYVGGMADLNKGVIRTIGIASERFKEDKLRLMRAIRFAARFNFQIEESTLAAIKAEAPHIVEVSWERIRDELLKMLMNANPDRALKLLKETGLLKHILPEVDAMAGVEQPKAFHPEGDVFEHTVLALKLFENDTEINKTDILALSILLHDIGKPATFYQAKDRIRFNNHDIVGGKMALNILKRLKLPNQTIDEVAFCIENHMRFMNARQMRQNTLKRFIRNSTFDTEMDLHKVDCLASHGDLEIHTFLKEKRQEFGAEKIAPTPLITGKRLIELGYQPGPAFRQMLTEVEDLQLEDKLTTTEEAENFIKKQFPLK